MEYLILTKIDSKDPQIEVDSHGYPEKFNHYKEAKAFAEKWQIERYVIVAVCDDKKNYLV